MIDGYTVFGLTGLHFIPIFALIYLQNEVGYLEKRLASVSTKLCTLIMIVVSFGIVLLNILLIEPKIQVISSIVLVLTLSLSANYTYKDYTIDEGYYISIPYFILYSCFVFLISRNEYPHYTLQSPQSIILLVITLLLYSLFLLSNYLRIEFHQNYYNYLAFVGLILSTVSIILTLNAKPATRSLIYLLLYHLMHVYLYLTHLLSIKFELSVD